MNYSLRQAEVGRTPWSAAGPPASLPRFDPAPVPFPRRPRCGAGFQNRFVLLSLPFFARRDDFVGQVGNLRRIVNPPAGSEQNAGESPEKFAACRYAGQDGILRPIGNRPTAAPIRQAGGLPTRRRLAACPTSGQRL